MQQKCVALMRGHTMYTLRPWRNPFHPESPFRWQGYIDGAAWRLFKTKADFEQAVALEPGPAPLGPHAAAAFRAETFSTHEGNRVLGIIRDKYAAAVAAKGA